MWKNNFGSKKLSFLQAVVIELLVLLPSLFAFYMSDLGAKISFTYILTVLCSFSILFYFINGKSFKDMEYKEYEKTLKPYFILLILGVNIVVILAIGIFIAF